MSMVRSVVGGVDTHADTHVAAVVDANGGILGIESFPAGKSGYGALLGWLSSHGEVQMVGVEGTGSWGVGVARFLHDREIIVVEVDRQNRQNRRKVGKSDTTDAVAAARAALSGSARVIPKARNGPVEQIRILMVARRSARSQRIETLNQLRHLPRRTPPSHRRPPRPHLSTNRPRRLRPPLRRHRQSRRRTTQRADRISIPADESRGTRTGARTLNRASRLLVHRWTQLAGFQSAV